MLLTLLQPLWIQAEMTSEQPKAVSFVLEHLEKHYVHARIGNDAASKMRSAILEGELTSHADGDSFGADFSQLLQRFTGVQWSALRIRF